MPLQKILFKPGVNRENTRYTTEGGWYECDKVRFRQGNPEVIGGWQQISGFTYSGVCRSLWNWTALDGANYIGVGTNVKFYISQGGYYYDITPIATTTTLGTDPFTANGTTTVTVTASTTTLTAGTYVTFSGATGTYASTFNAEYQIVSVGSASFTITVPTALTAGSYGGSAVVAAYQVSAGPATPIPLLGWGAGAWGQTGTTWGNGGTSTSSLRLWNQINYGEDLVYGPRGGAIYYWDKSGGVSTRGVLLSSLGGTVSFTNASPTVVTSTVAYTEGAALQFSGGSLPTGITAGTTYIVYEVVGLTFKLLTTAGAAVNTSSAGTGSVSNIVDCPVVQNNLTVSDSSRFVMVFGCNDYGSATMDPMLIRWSGQNDPYNWTPDPTNQAGFTRLSHGSQIVTTVQTRQEIVVFTDSSVYSLQYLGPPFVWAPQLLGDNISIISPNSAVIASGIVYWMGVDKFYSYDGRLQTLNCDLRRFVFGDLNQEQALQVSCGTNEGFNEVWWFYCSADSTAVDRYVIYNYAEKVWYYGTMSRTAWLDSGLQPYPIAAIYDSTTATGNLVYHENGINDNATSTTASINAYISSSEFDIGDGHNFGFVWRVLPDLTFENATSSPTGAVATTTMTLYGLANSGSGVTSSANQPVAKSSTYVITEEFTGMIFTRMRGRQMIFKIESNQINTCWQLGAPRIDITSGRQALMTSKNRILTPAPPNLPLGTDQYERRYQDQFTNVLRLYFNQLQNAFGEIFGPDGGKYIAFPHIAASDAALQYATAANTPTIIQWTSLDSGTGFTLNANNTATAQVPGIYKITYSLQFANNDNAAHDAIVWLRIDGSTSAADVPSSTTVFTVQPRKSAGIPNYVCGYSEVVFTLRAGNSVGLWWGTDQAATSGGATGIYIDYQTAQTTPMAYPAVPSAIGSITFVSALPA